MNGRVLLIAVLLAMSVAAQATGGERYLGAGLAVGLAAGGAGIGVGIAGAAAISAIIEKPQERVWYIIFVALAEACAIYGLLISFLLL